VAVDVDSCAKAPIGREATPASAIAAAPVPMKVRLEVMQHSFRDRSIAGASGISIPAVPSGR
jgi:hypothetical protein